MPAPHWCRYVLEFGRLHLQVLLILAIDPMEARLKDGSYPNPDQRYLFSIV